MNPDRDSHPICEIERRYTNISAPFVEERRDAVTLLVKQRGQNLKVKRDR